MRRPAFDIVVAGVNLQEASFRREISMNCANRQ